MVKRYIKITLVVVLLLLVIAGFYIYNYFNIKPSIVSSENIATVPINYSNFASAMNNNPIVLDIPSDSAILLKFYNVNSGKVNIEKSYILSEEGVKEGNLNNAGIILSMNSKYLTVLNNKNFCGVVQEARNNQDLGIETSLSKTDLAWKYKKLYRYRECFGF